MKLTEVELINTVIDHFLLYILKVDLTLKKTSFEQLEISLHLVVILR